VSYASKKKKKKNNERQECEAGHVQERVAGGGEGKGG
jgi:hypothetical protein